MSSVTGDVLRKGRCTKKQMLFFETVSVLLRKKVVSSGTDGVLGNRYSVFRNGGVIGSVWWCYMNKRCPGNSLVRVIRNKWCSQESFKTGSVLKNILE